MKVVAENNGLVYLLSLLPCDCQRDLPAVHRPDSLSQHQENERK